MGYTTDFDGRFELNKQLTCEHASYLLAFSSSRRMARDSALTEMLPDKLRTAVNLSIGFEGSYYVNDSQPEYIIDYNSPPGGQPGLWCQWVPSDDNKAIIWDGGEKFYNYVEWIEYIIKHFLAPWGYILGGAVQWSGESAGDSGVISINNNVVTTIATYSIEDNE